MDAEIAAIVAHAGGQRGSGPRAVFNGDLAGSRCQGVMPSAEGSGGDAPGSIYGPREELARHRQGSHSEHSCARSEEDARDAEANQEALRQGCSGGGEA